MQQVVLAALDRQQATCKLQALSGRDTVHVITLQDLCCVGDRVTWSQSCCWGAACAAYLQGSPVDASDQTAETHEAACRASNPATSAPAPVVCNGTQLEEWRLTCSGFCV